MSEELKLKAADDGDLAILSACLQDAILPASDMTFQPDDNRFIMIVNRFCWETRMGLDGKGAKPHADCERVISAVHFNQIEGVHSRGFDRDDKTALMEILAVTYDDEAITLHFCGGARIKLTTPTINATLHDLGDHWQVKTTPQHEG